MLEKLSNKLFPNEENLFPSDKNNSILLGLLRQ